MKEHVKAAGFWSLLPVIFNALDAARKYLVLNNYETYCNGT